MLLRSCCCYVVDVAVAPFPAQKGYFFQKAQFSNLLYILDSFRARSSCLSAPLAYWKWRVSICSLLSCFLYNSLNCSPLKEVETNSEFWYNSPTPQKNYSEYFSIETGARKYRNTTFLLFNLPENFRLIWCQKATWWNFRCKISIFSSLFRQRTVGMIVKDLVSAERVDSANNAVLQTRRREPVF